MSGDGSFTLCTFFHKKQQSTEHRDTKGEKPRGESQKNHIIIIVHSKSGSTGVFDRIT